MVPIEAAQIGIRCLPVEERGKVLQLLLVPADRLRAFGLRAAHEQVVLDGAADGT